jgi:hypothetical protein
MARPFDRDGKQNSASWPEKFEVGGWGLEVGLTGNKPRGGVLCLVTRIIAVLNFTFVFANITNHLKITQQTCFTLHGFIHSELGLGRRDSGVQGSTQRPSPLEVWGHVVARLRKCVFGPERR